MSKREPHPSHTGAGQPVQRGPRGTLVMEPIAPVRAGALERGLHPPQAAVAPVLGVVEPARAANPHWPIPAHVLAKLPSAQAIRPTLGPRHALVPFTGSGSVNEWLQYAARVYEYDKAVEARSKKLNTIAVILLIVGIVTIWVFGLGVIPILISIYLFVHARKLALQDVEDRRLEVLTTSLFTFGPELKPHKPVAVKLDFTGYDKHPSTALPGLKLYCQPWLDLSLPLEDGCAVDIAVTLRVKEKSRSKRKYTRIKSKQMEIVTVRVSPPTGKFFRQNPELIRHTGRRIAGLALARATVQPERAVFVWTTAPTVHVRGSSGWYGAATNHVDGAKLVAAIVASYKLSALGERGAVRGPS